MWRKVEEEKVGKEASEKTRGKEKRGLTPLLNVFHIVLFPILFFLLSLPSLL